MRTEQHLACPKCGYDLFGLPNGRCPECGFGFDAEAIKSLARDAEWTRLDSAQSVIIRSTMSLALTIPLLVEGMGLRGPPLVFVVVACSVAAFLTWASMTDRLQSFDSVAILVKPVAFAAVVVVYFWFGFKLFIVPAAVGVLAAAWYPRLRSWPPVDSGDQTKDTPITRVAVRSSHVASIMLSLATILTFVFLLTK